MNSAPVHEPSETQTQPSVLPAGHAIEDPGKVETHLVLELTKNSSSLDLITVAYPGITETALVTITVTADDQELPPALLTAVLDKILEMPEAEPELEDEMKVKFIDEYSQDFNDERDSEKESDREVDAEMSLKNQVGNDTAMTSAAGYLAGLDLMQASDDIAAVAMAPAGKKTMEEENDKVDTALQTDVLLSAQYFTNSVQVICPTEGSVEPEDQAGGEATATSTTLLQSEIEYAGLKDEIDWNAKAAGTDEAAVDMGSEAYAACTSEHVEVGVEMRETAGTFSVAKVTPSLTVPVSMDEGRASLLEDQAAADGTESLVMTTSEYEDDFETVEATVVEDKVMHDGSAEASEVRALAAIGRSETGETDDENGYLPQGQPRQKVGLVL
jgi:hypothetical protein